MESLLTSEAAAALCLEVVGAMDLALHVYKLEDREDDRTLRIIAANAACEKLTGRPVSEDVGRLFEEAYANMRERGIPQGYAEVVRTGRPWRFHYVVHDERGAVLVANAVLAFALPGDHVGVVFGDDTPRYNAQHDLRVSVARERALVEALPDTLYRVSQDGALHDVKRGTVGPAALALRVAAYAAAPLAPGDVRVFECRQGDADIEVRLVRSSEQELLAICRDITERKRGERLKDEFISVVSHELRTPLTSIRGALGLVEGGVVGVPPTSMQELVAVARSNADRLIRLINDMLDLDKMEAGRLELDILPIDAVELVDAALAGLRGAADLAGVRLRRVGDASVAVLGDRDRLLQVLTNLLSNAVRFSPPQATVTVTVTTPSPDRVRFTVEDKGPGVPPDRAAHLFRKFTQVGGDGARRRGGTGLGLAISKAIVDQHGGTIAHAPSSAPGATFYFELPITPEPPVEIEEPSADDLFADLRAAYAASLPTQIDTLLERVARSDADPSARAEALGLAHRLKGTAGTYGLSGVSEAAASLERALLDDPGAIDGAVRALRHAVRRG